jgi:beta-galactosidase
MSTHRFLALVGFCFASAIASAAEGRIIRDFDANWRFNLGDANGAMVAAFDDHSWRGVQLPHDWSSDGPFSAAHASGTGYAPGGIGWYRKHFSLDATAAGKTILLEFDGVYDNSEVWINGHFVGGRPYGYSSFRCDLTGLVKCDGSKNVVAVRVDHSRVADSRYYTGSGIYRNVRLVIADNLHVAPWGVCVTTPKIKTDSATVSIVTAVENRSAENKSFTLQTEIVAPDGTVVATGKTKVTSPAGGDSREISQELSVRQPQLWDVQTPRLYQAVTKVICDGAIVDSVTTPFGIREFHFDADKGFFLNGKSLKLKGVCLHHDAGSLGAAVPEPVWERRLVALKEIGVNAIRTSHNPPDPVLLDLCDRLGFLVMDEALDEFTPAKNKWVRGWNAEPASRFGYAEIFHDWAGRDVADMVRRDRNHPSIILWSIGNEIDYANDPFSHPVLGDRYNPANPPAENLVTLAKPLVAAVKANDKTRPVTAALATVAMSDAVGLPDVLDVVGYNYQEGRYAEDHQKYPKRVIYGSENGHPYDAWLAVRDNDYISGQFLWTGVDYLGEANAWPNRANGAGLFDLCGFKKPNAWFRQSLWSDQPMVYACASAGFGRRGFGVESWNWPSNSTVMVHIFANCSEVALSLNGKLIGTRKMSEARRGVLNWEVPFEPGVLKVTGRRDGKEVCSYALETTTAPSRIELLPDVKQTRANGKDVCQIEFRIVDEQGRRVPDAETEVSFELAGPARLLGIGNGNLSSTEDDKDLKQHAHQGRGVLILQTTPNAGDISVKAAATGLAPAWATIPSR